MKDQESGRLKPNENHGGELKRQQDKQLCTQNEDRRGRSEKTEHQRVCLEQGFWLKKESGAEMGSVKSTSWYHASKEGET